MGGSERQLTEAGFSFLGYRFNIKSVATKTAWLILSKRSPLLSWRSATDLSDRVDQAVLFFVIEGAPEMSRFFSKSKNIEVSSRYAKYLGLNEACVIGTLQKYGDNLPRSFADLKALFPYWDKNVLRRALNNLQNDGFLTISVVDSNLSLYTLNYEILNRLSEPISRIKNKKIKRQKARESRQIDHQAGFLYICQAPGQKGYKIGVTNNVSQRMKQLGANLVRSFPVDDMAKSESYWHQLFAPKRLNGEWFDLTEDDITTISFSEI